MKIDILTLFPEMFVGPFSESIVKHAQAKGHVDIKIHALRQWAIDARGTVDDRPYGGGAGMIIRVEVIDKALAELKQKNTKVILLDAGGTKFTQKHANELAKSEHIIMIAGHYEGVDHRIHENLVDEIISIGDYVLTGGELPAMVLTDSIVRLIPEVIDPESLKEESHSEDGYTEYAQYTRPEDFKGWKVPKVLLSGNHAEIVKWRKGQK